MTFDIDLAEYAVEYGKSHNVDYIEARLVIAREESYSTRNGEILGAGITPTSGIGIRVLNKGSVGFTSTAKLNRNSIEDAVKNAVKYANANNRKNPIKFSEEKAIQTKWSSPFKIRFEDVAIEEKQKFLMGIDAELEKEFGKDLPNRIILLNLNSEQKYIVNSDGSSIESELYIPTIHTFNTAIGKSGTEQRMLGRGGTAGWEWFSNNTLLDEIMADNRSLIKTAKNAVEMNLGKIDVVVSSEVAGIMAHENVGHPSESDRILGREGAQAGESFYLDLLKEGEIGNIKMGNPEVTIVDDPSLPGSSGFYLYDDECVKARPRELIKNGMLNELLLNREFAERYDLESNGSARAITYDREPIVRMANTYFKPGSFTLDEMVEDIKEGMYMKSFTEWNIDDRRFQSKYVGLECYLIKDGQITDQMIKRPVLELTTFGILGSVDAVSKEFDAPHGICGKCDPMQGVPVWMGGGEVRMRNITLGGN
ncbi:TldD/PmbA family protein [Promethearchaeum syntrophicum]|uniref:TldD/PmbA family protein n=1 Tax=Promethearchaeum syntrophicum TaxID=2594042 RepID=A0A5B9D5G9_9ARCH|nr:TldD/PmbA family protein [Candidatus Prometheoarchaeum syntrophicum]QEE14349.1 protease TldD [Candidatus Prometheoarchaeum syntrophicum]